MEDSMGKSRNLKDFLLNQDPWILLFIFLFSIVFAVSAFISNARDLNYTLPSYNELKVIEGTVDNFSIGPGRDNIYFELTVNDGETYYLNKYIVYHYSLRRIIQKNSSVRIWINEGYKNSFPNQVYEIEINGNKCLLYEESCDFLIECHYKKNVLSGTELMFFSFIVCAYVCASFAFQLLSKPSIRHE